MHFRMIGELAEIETIATGSGIREVARLRKRYGRGSAELHWYEATGIGRREFKIKRLLMR